MSGNHDAELLREPAAVGAFGYLEKPFDIDVLARVVAAAIRSVAGGHDCGCPICARALQTLRSIVTPSEEQPEAFLVRLDTEATVILRYAGEEFS